MQLAPILCFCLTTAVLAVEPVKLLELHVGESKFLGRLAARDQESVWLLQNDGRLRNIAIGEVTDYKALAGPFRPASSAELRDRLRGEFGRDVEIAPSTHYLVVAEPGQAKRFAGLFEDLYRNLYVYLSARQFRIHEPEFPLVAVVFPDQAKFAEYCQRENVTPMPGLRGYYLQTSNRVALYDTGTSDLDETVIHEAVHQVAFNVGLHRRMSDNPLWLLEGLATTFEPENFRKPLPNTPVSAKINRSRYLHFRNYMERRPAKSLAEFLQSDDLFKSAPLDAYSQAWALTFYLMETRSQQYGRYLKVISSRPPLETYEPDARLEDFRQAFGQNIESLETELLRYMSRLVN